jgi:hypothetical protein
MLGDSYLRSTGRYWGGLTTEQQEAVKTSYHYPSLVPLPNKLGFMEALTGRMIVDVGGDVRASVQTVVANDSQVNIKVVPEEDGRTSYQIQTPWGTLDETVAGSGSAETVFREKFAINSRSDYEIMRRVINDRVYQAMYGNYAEKRRSLAGIGACSVWGPDQPLVSLFRVRDPVELIFDLQDEPDKLKEMLDEFHDKALEGYRLIAQGPGIAVETGMAFITTQLISPRIFERTVLPYLAEYAQLLHESGKILITHMCGHIRHFLPLLREAGIDGIDSLSNPPIGDTPLETFWEILGEDAVLQGGLDVQILLHGTCTEVQVHVKDVIRRTAGRHLILSSADEVPYGTTMENLLVVRDTIRMMTS